MKNLTYKRCNKYICSQVVAICMIGIVAINSFADGVPVKTPKLLINEVSSSPYGEYYKQSDDNYDWIELKNLSGNTIQLSDFYISDDENSPMKCRLPAVELQDGELFVVRCDDSNGEKIFSTGFKLDSDGEKIIVCDSKGEIVDEFEAKAVPCGCSCGRMSGETSGIAFFTEPTEGKENINGGHKISKEVSSNIEGGLYNKAQSLELKADGKIFYTTDGSKPDESSKEYTGEPIIIDKTTIIRAVSIEPDCIPGNTKDLFFAIDEGHSLPVVSLVTDNIHHFNSCWTSGNKDYENPGSITFYDNGTKFSLGCGISITGKSSRYEFPKKNLKIEFRSAYGAKKLKYDLFDTSEDSYSSIILRAGQDSAFRLFNGEIWQDAAFDIGNRVLSQHTKYCILYINGRYYGIYGIKENISKTYYSDWAGCNKNSVISAEPRDEMPDIYIDGLYELYKNHDLSKPEEYEKFCNMVDVDSYIDWLILEGISGNMDLFKNYRLFYNSETGKWQFVLYDLDAAMKSKTCSWDCLFNNAAHVGYPNSHVSGLLLNVIKNKSFQDLLLKRYAEIYDSGLSNKEMLERIEHYKALLKPEIERDRTTWYYSTGQWEIDVNYLERIITEADWQNLCVEKLCKVYLHMNDEQIAKYFSK